MHPYRFILTIFSFCFYFLVNQIYSKTIKSLLEHSSKRNLQSLNENPCFQLFQRNNSLYQIKSFNSSWSKNAYSELTFTIQNSCNFEIGIKNNLIIVIEQWKINGLLIRDFYESQDSTPYLDIYATIKNNKIYLELSSYNCITGLCERAKFSKNGTKEITLTVTSYTNIYSSVVNSIYLDGFNTTKVPGNLLLSIDSSNILSYFNNKSLITASIFNYINSKLVTNIIFDPLLSKGNYSESISGLEPSLYYIEINRSSVPVPSGLSMGIIYSPNNNITVESNKTTKIYVSFNITTLPPNSLGNITIQLPKLPSEFLGKVNLNAILSNISKNYNNSMLFNSSSSTISVNNLLVNSTYDINLPGLAYPSLNRYVPPIKLTTPKITNGNDLNVDIAYGGIITDGLFDVSFDVSGYNESQSIPVSFVSNLEKYVYVDDFLLINNSQIFKFPIDEEIKIYPKIPFRWKVQIIPEIITSSTTKVNLIFSRQNPLIGGYYESKISKWASSGKEHTLSQIPSYISRILIAFANPNNNYIGGSESLKETGLLFTSDFNVIKSAIALGRLMNPNQKFILSVGGPNYQWKNVNYVGLIDLMNDLNLDGIDIHYLEVPYCTGLDMNNLTCSSDKNLIQIIDKFSDIKSKGKILTASVISVGAYGTPNFPISKYGPISNYSGMWVNPLKNSKTKLDELYILSYDASLSFSPIDAFNAYQSIFENRIYLGLEVPNESWGDYVLNESDALKFANYTSNSNGNGVFIWSLEKSYSNMDANNFIGPICKLYGYSNCAEVIPSN